MVEAKEGNIDGAIFKNIIQKKKLWKMVPVPSGKGYSIGKVD